MREESDPSHTGVEIIADRLSFAALALPQIAILRDKFIGLMSQLNDLRLRAKRAHQQEETAARRPSAIEPPAQRAATESAASSASSASAPRRFRVLKAWNAGKQQAAAHELCVVDHLHIKYFVAAERHTKTPTVFRRRNARAEPCGALLCDNEDEKRCAVHEPKV